MRGVRVPKETGYLKRKFKRRPACRDDLPAKSSSHFAIDDNASETALTTRIDGIPKLKLLSHGCRGVADLFNGGQKFLMGYAEVFHPPVNFMRFAHMDVRPIFQSFLQ